MKKQITILAVCALSLPVFAQQTNSSPLCTGTEQISQKKTGENERKRREHKELSPEKKEEMQVRRLQLMEKTLQEIGVTDEQKTQIVALQKQLKDRMHESSTKVDEARNKLKDLEKSGAPETEIYIAIDEVSNAQAEQMKILARNRIQMERILGKEKFELFMDSARYQWKEHGRRNGSEMPPVPNEDTDSPPLSQTTVE
jgi:Spy/CpxP family protein refolding chaperone